MTHRVIDNFRERLRQCVDNNGSHLTDLIFKTYWNRKALYVLFENKNPFLFVFFLCLLLDLQICQIILLDPVFIFWIKNFNTQHRSWYSQTLSPILNCWRMSCFRDINFSSSFFFFKFLDKFILQLFPTRDLCLHVHSLLTDV